MYIVNIARLWNLIDSFSHASFYDLATGCLKYEQPDVNFGVSKDPAHIYKVHTKRGKILPI